MKNKKTLLIFLLFLISYSLFAEPAFSASQAAEYLCDLGVSFYKRERYEEALTEFKKALLLEPDNKIALNYINNVFNRPVQQAASPVEQPAKIIAPQVPILENKKVTTSRDQVILSALNSYSPVQSQDKSINQTLPIDQTDKAISYINSNTAQGNFGVLDVHGDIALGVGFTSDDFIWKDANADKIGVPREKNWRYLWGDEKHNTYDKRIFDRLNLDIETKYNSPWNAFMEITVDPWTFVSKKDVTSYSNVGGDFVDMRFKYWSADRRTANEVYRSNKGNIINIKQNKVVDGKTSLINPTALNDWFTDFNQIEQQKLKMEYRPLRKLWINYIDDDYTLKIFPISDQFEALTTDDPLRLSDNRHYWEEGAWLDEYEPSRVFYPDSGLKPIKRGRWIRRMSFFTKDSSDDYPHRLTFLRGATFKTKTDSYSFQATVATPMSLWDNYENSNSINYADRLKIPLNEDLQVGMVNTVKLGLNKGSLEAQNEVTGLDLNYNLDCNTVFSAEAAGSYTRIGEDPGFYTVYHGLAGKAGVKYDESKEKKGGFYKSEVYAAHMGNKFFPGLSNYRYTRSDDPTFSRNVYFDEIGDINIPLIWGDGMDRARNALGLKFNIKGFDERLDNDIKYRNVHEDTGKYVESVLRVESTYKANPRLTTKLLGYYQHLPKTHANQDPLLYLKTMYSLTDYFSDVDAHPENSVIVDDKDPSIGAFGAGAHYYLIEECLAVEGIYQRTNDPLDFPRGLLNDNYVTTETRDGHLWDKVSPFLYDQSFFSTPPYRYYDIARTRLIYTPNEKWEHIFRFTYNENRYASALNYNLNHAGLETTYKPNEKWTFWGSYIYSRLIDVYKQNEHQKRAGFSDDHHNFFIGTEYKLNKDEAFNLLYGEFVAYKEPFQQGNWCLSSLDTQHIVRVSYRRKF
ncbi:MAG: tetratricopeptide repeat protein [Candidatus Omnitrophota bacterium]